MRRCHIDFETRSTVDLRKTGVRPYVEHPDTDVWFCGWAIDDGPVQVWYPEDPLPDEFREALEDPDTMVVAHNAGFEWNVIEYVCVPRYGWPRVPHTRLDDTAARAAVMALPRSLDGASRAVGLDVEKDVDGRRLMLQMCKPRRFDGDEPVWWDAPEKVERLAQYCVTDVEVERQLDKKLRRLTEPERALWELDFEINHVRGVRVDTQLVRKSGAVLNASLRSHDAALSKLTGGRVTAVSQIEPLRQWVLSRGFETDTLDKAAVDALLSEDLDERTRAALTIRKEAGKTSTAKLKTFLAQTAADGRAYGALMYHGASTGRWTGSGIQLHNLPRPSMNKKAVRQAIDVLRSNRPIGETMETLEFLFGPVPTVLSDCLRGMLIPSEGTRFIVSDFSNIEGRGAAWLAGQEAKLDIFRANGPVYERMGSIIFGVPLEEVTKESIARFVGKQAELGCGYGMGWSKFQQSCASFGQTLTDELCQHSVETFRKVNNKLVQLWADLEEAATLAVQDPGTAYRIPNGKIAFQCHRKRHYMVCKLPSGRYLYYIRPRIEETETPWGATRDALTYETTNSYTRKWSRVSTFGGKLTENVVQAIARDMLAEAMMRLETAGYRVVLTVHDEIVAEAPHGFGSQEEFDRIMSEVPVWAEGFPVAVEGFEADRYRK
jgi:DNA polymerase